MVCVVLGISACWEFFEWWSALIGGDAADDFLGTQGDIWDTRWDMFLAMLGAILSQLLFARIHDRRCDDSPVSRASATRRPDHRAVRVRVDS